MGDDANAWLDLVLPAAAIAGSAIWPRSRVPGLGLAALGSYQASRSRSKYNDLMTQRDSAEAASNEALAREVMRQGGLTTNDQTGEEVSTPIPVGKSYLDLVGGKPGQNAATAADIPQPRIDPNVARLSAGAIRSRDVQGGLSMAERSAQDNEEPSVAELTAGPAPAYGTTITQRGARGATVTREGLAPAKEVAARSLRLEPHIDEKGNKWMYGFDDNGQQISAYNMGKEYQKPDKGEKDKGNSDRTKVALMKTGYPPDTQLAQLPKEAWQAYAKNYRDATPSLLEELGITGGDQGGGPGGAAAPNADFVYDPKTGTIQPVKKK